MPLPDVVVQPGKGRDRRWRDRHIAMQPRGAGAQHEGRSQARLDRTLDRDGAHAGGRRDIKRVLDAFEHRTMLKHHPDGARTSRSPVSDPAQHEFDFGSREADIVSTNETHRVRDDVRCQTSRQDHRRPHLVGLEQMIPVDRSVVDERIDQRMPEIGKRRTPDVPLELLAPRSG